MSRYHDATTGKFVTKEYAKDNPETTVKLTHLDLRKELLNFAKFYSKQPYYNLSKEEIVDQYLKEKE